MNRLAHRFVATKRERDIGEPTGNLGIRQGCADLSGGFDEGPTIVVMFRDTGRDREDIGIEDDIFGREIRLVDQKPVGAGADLHLALDGVGLTGLVEGHHHHRRAIAPRQLRLLQEVGFAFLHADRIGDRFALQAFQTSFDHCPVR